MLKVRRERAGKCADCNFVRVTTNAKGNDFFRCARADEDRRFLKYPPLPVRACDGFEPTR